MLLLGYNLCITAASALGPHPSSWHRRPHDTLGNVTIPNRVTLLGFLKLKTKYGHPQGQKRARCRVVLLPLPAFASSGGKGLPELLLTPPVSSGGFLPVAQQGSKDRV